MKQSDAYFDETVVEEEADGGGAGDGGLLEPRGRDGGHELVELRARLGVEIDGELMTDRGFGAFGDADERRDDIEAEGEDEC